MQQDADLLNALRTDLAELTALHAPSGSEQPVIARLRDLFTPLVDAVVVDHMGNLTATREGPQGAPHVVVSAHADEIGAIVTSIESEGFLRLAPLGGVQSRLLEGRAVWVGGHHGVIGARSGHLTPQGEQGRGVSIADLYVDLGVDDAAAVEELGVRVGDPIVVISELRTLAGTRVAGKGIDNRASCVVLLHLLRRLKEQPLPCRLTALVAVQEEVGLRGATAAFARLQPDLAIVLDTFPAAGTPDTRHMAYNACIGQGVLITPASGSGDFGFLLPRAARDAIIAAAQRAGVPYQLAIASGGVTDAAAAHLVAGGIATLPSSCSTCGTSLQCCLWRRTSCCTPRQPRNYPSWAPKNTGDYSAGGAGGRSPPAGARGVLASFSFPRLPPQAAQERHLKRYEHC